MTIFGQIVTGPQVEQAVIATVNAWQLDYLREVERQLGFDVGALPPIQSFTTRNAFQHWPEEQLPAAVVVSPGLVGKPVKDGTGVYQARWEVGVVVVLQAPTRGRARELAGVYAAAVGTLLSHKGTLGGFAAGFDWADEGYDDVPEELARNHAAGAVSGEVIVDAARTSRGGPAEPSPTPEVAPPDWPVVVDRAHVIHTVTIETGSP